MMYHSLFLFLFLSLFSHASLKVNTNALSATFTQEEQQWIAQHPTVTACMSNDWAPFSYHNDNNKLVGLSKDYLDAISKLAGLHITYKSDRTWAQMLEDIKGKHCDIIADIYFTKERTEHINFTAPYLYQKEYFFTRIDAPTIYEISQLKGKKVALVKGYSIVAWIQENYPEITIIGKDTIAECLHSVVSKESDAFIGDNPSTQYTLEKNFITDIKIDTVSGGRSTRKLLLGTRKDYAILATILTKAMLQMSEEEDQRIKLKWFNVSNKNKVILSAKERKWLESNPTVTYVYDADWKPFEWKNDFNLHTGIVSDILKLIERRSGIKFIADTSDLWSESMQKVKSKKVAMFSAVGITEDNSHYLHFTTKPLFSTPYVFVSRKDENYPNGFNDLEDKKITTIKNYAIHAYLTETKPHLKPILTNTITEGLTLVKDGKADVMILNVTTAKYYINFLNYDTLKVAYKMEHSLEPRIAFHKQEATEALSIINKTMQTINAKDINDIFHKWTEIKVEKALNWEKLLWILAIAGFIILIFLLFNNKLRSLVKEKTKELYALNKNLEHQVLARTKDLTDTNEQLQIAVNTDSMTGAYNRRYFFNIAEELIALAKKNGSFLFIAILDIDHFKNVNDKYGHDIGDKVIKDLVKEIHASIKDEDILVRFGGEEFLLVFPNNSQKKVLSTLEILRESIQSSVLIDSHPITVSIGVSVLLEEDNSIDTTVKRADVALYKAKVLGRNRVKYL